VIEDELAMLRESGTYYVVGHGGDLKVATKAIVSSEINFVGNFMGTYNELAELSVLEALGKVIQHARAYPLDVVNDALADLGSGRLYGSGILMPSLS
jgi:NAD+-dependent secondary alcohol dehydrogenase Adh1